MASLEFLVTESNTKKRKDSASTTVDFLSIKVGTSALEMKETSGNFDFSGKKLVNLADPTNPQEAATRAYVLANAGGGGLKKVSARVHNASDQSFASGQRSIVWGNITFDPNSIISGANNNVFTIPSAVFTGSVSVKVTMQFSLVSGTNNFASWRLWAPLVYTTNGGLAVVAFGQDTTSDGIGSGLSNGIPNGSINAVAAGKALAGDVLDVQMYSSQSITKEGQPYMDYMLIELEQL